LSKTILKLMIVDDEDLVRDLFKHCLNWQELEACISGEAAGAREALELIEQEIPDIIFTDICMPYMDGIEFSRIVREKYPWIKIVILTGHEEFEYAKRSIQAGVTGFLLKPIQDQEIKQAILDLKAKIIREQAERDEYRHLKKQLTENLPYLKEKFFNELLHNQIGTFEIKGKIEYFQIDFQSNSFQVAIIEITPDNQQCYSGTEEQLIVGMQAMDLVAEYYGGKHRIHIFFDYQQRIVILNNDPLLDIPVLLESVKMLLQKQLNCSVTIGIGRNYPSPESIHYSYREAVEALRYKLLIGKDQIISYNDLNFIPLENSPADYQNDEFVFFIKAGCSEKAVNWLELFFTEIGNNHTLTIDSLRAKAFMILATILNTIDELGLRIGDVFDGDNEPYDQILKNDTIPEMKKYLTDLVLNITAVVRSLHDKKECKIAKEIQEYLMQNLANEDLSLTKVAKEFYLNPSYLSRIFKQATGTTFVEYLTKIRMETAIKLLRETDKKAYQIGETIGIPDPHYFGICFKKYTGMSINEFRKI
jgi:two-component system response regulator YesN